ncbi:hypothetical protein [Micromonospora endolithica]|nr:hypothetical protein [Micromonospora endolithica]
MYEVPLDRVALLKRRDRAAQGALRLVLVDLAGDPRVLLRSQRYES